MTFEVIIFIPVCFPDKLYWSWNLVPHLTCRYAEKIVPMQVWFPSYDSAPKSQIHDSQNSRCPLYVDI